jgi:outer membrane lipoprotein-sorting protein
MAAINDGRRAVLGALAMMPLVAFAARAQTHYALTPQDSADLARIQTYLNDLKTLKAKFLQVAPNGATSRGIAWLDRPGRMRFQYDPPSPLLLVAGHGLVVFHDNVTFGGDVTVSGVQRQPGMIQVTIYQTARPGDGTLTLNFADNPLALRQWTVVDAQRRETRVSLYDISVGGSFDQSLFTFIDPRFYQNNDQH